MGEAGFWKGCCDYKKFIFEKYKMYMKSMKSHVLGEELQTHINYFESMYTLRPQNNIISQPFSRKKDMVIPHQVYFYVQQ